MGYESRICVYLPNFFCSVKEYKNTNVFPSFDSRQAKQVNGIL